MFSLVSPSPTQGVLDQNSLPVPPVGGDRLPTHNALHVPPDRGGRGRQLWAAEPGAEHQPDVHRAAGEMRAMKREHVNARGSRDTTDLVVVVEEEIEVFVGGKAN